MFEKIIRGIGRRLLNYGCENNQSAKTLDYRWTDPQNEKEAIIFLAKRLQFSAERCKAKKIAPHAFLESVKIIAETKAIKSTKGITRFLPKIKGCRTDAKQNGHTPDNHAAVIFA